jgi:hypothetical protein
MVDRRFDACWPEVARPFRVSLSLGDRVPSLTKDGALDVVREWRFNGR